MRKLYQPNVKDIQLTNVLHALSDPVRLSIVRTLASNQERVNCHTIEVPVAKSTASHHFKVLREAGITDTQIEGPQHLTRLRWDDLEVRFPGLLQAVLGATEPF